MSEERPRVTLISTDQYGPAAGVRCLSAALRRAGFATRVIYAEGAVTERVARGEALAFDPSVHDGIAQLAEGSLFVGVSLVTPTFHKAREITAELRRRSSLPVVWGGVHANVRSEECLKHADAVCYGEGEDVIVEVARRAAAGEPFAGLPGLLLPGQTPSCTEARLTEAADIPTPDYALDGTHFVASRRGIETIGAGDALRRHVRTDYYVAPTRGCPRRCTYCVNSSYAQMFGARRRFRKRDLDAVLAELIAASRELGMRRVIIDDDCFMAMRDDEIREFSAVYARRVGLPFIIRGVHPDTLSEEKLGHLCDAGLVKLRMGIQTGSDRIRELYRRTHETNESILTAAGLINRFIRARRLDFVMYDVIVDNPWESEEDARATLELVLSLPRPFALYCFSLTFYPGTPLYDRALAERRVRGDTLDDAYWRDYFAVAPTRINNVLALPQRFGVPARLGRFLAVPGDGRLAQRVADATTRGLLLAASSLPELALFSRSRLRYEADFLAAHDAAAFHATARAIDEAQRRKGTSRVVIWLRACLRRIYLALLAPGRPLSHSKVLQPVRLQAG